MVVQWRNPWRRKKKLPTSSTPALALATTRHTILSMCHSCRSGALLIVSTSNNNKHNMRLLPRRQHHRSRALVPLQVKVKRRMLHQTDQIAPRVTRRAGRARKRRGKGLIIEADPETRVVLIVGAVAKLKGRKTVDPLALLRLLLLLLLLPLLPPRQRILGGATPCLRRVRLLDDEHSEMRSSRASYPLSARSTQN